MDQNLAAVMQKRIERTIAALNKNRFDAHFIKNKEELFLKLQEWLPEGVSCSVGGSMTLFETGVVDYIKSGNYRYIDRYAPGVDGPRVYRDALSCDVYFTSSNAVTENGELYNMDGNGNRVAAIAYGPKKVVVIAGANKIVKDLDEAKARLKAIAAPANGVRLNKDIPCAKTGLCADCKSPMRFCCHELTSHFQYLEKRIGVLILPDSYGY